jgi:DNA-directed RNA polymerase specialized sigma24 family protein
MVATTMNQPPKVYSRGYTHPAPERDPEHRPRLVPTEEQAARDQRIARMLAHGWSYRETAAHLGCSLGAIQRSVARTRARNRRLRALRRG